MKFFFNDRQCLIKQKASALALKKDVLKSFLASSFFSKSYKIFWFKFFLKFTKMSSISYGRNFCLITNWARSVFRDFKMSRHQAKAFSSFGFIRGMRKSSF